MPLLFSQTFLSIPSFNLWPLLFTSYLLIQIYWQFILFIIYLYFLYLFNPNFLKYSSLFYQNKFKLLTITLLWIRKEAKNWWKQAKKDLEVAEKNFEIEEYYVTVFFCQQSVEKALKALFIIKKSKFPEQTHSLIYLGKQLQIDHQFFSLLQDLTPEFVTTRYPDIVGEAPFELYGKDNALYFLKRTMEFFKWIENQIQ